MQDQASIGQARQAQIAGVDFEIWEGGSGSPVLLLHPGDGFDPAAPYVAALAGKHRVIAPSCPGFGKSALPKWLKRVDDLSYLYLDLIDSLKVDNLVMLGLSFGGWIAAEVAVKNTRHIAGLCLVDTLGAKFSNDPTVREIHDLFSYPQYEQAQWIYHDEKLRNQTYGHLADDVAVTLARNHESFGLFGWAPTLHSPNLARRLHRIDVPTLLIWGAQDRVAPPSYGRLWQSAISGARLAMIDNAGHYPQIEQPERFGDAVESFIASLPTAQA